MEDAMRHIAPTILLILITAGAVGFTGPSEAYRTLNPVLESGDLTDEQKLAAIGEFFDDPNSLEALGYVARVDPGLAARRLEQQFRNPERTIAERLAYARRRITRASVQLGPRPGNRDERFLTDYADFLLHHVLHGGAAAFHKPQVEFALTAVGEYAHIAAGFEGHDPNHFQRLADARAIPVLIDCLDAPDWVHGPPGGCIRHDKEGEPTGRNVPRQLLPIALARLDARQAIEPLKNVLRQHHDWYLRDNAAYALGVLLDPGQRQPVIDYLRTHRVDPNGDADHWKRDRYRHLYAFGRGLLERGDEAGIAYMDFEYSIYWKRRDLTSVTYMVKQRINALEGVRSARLAGFVAQALEYPPLAGALLFDPDRIEPPTNGTLEGLIEHSTDELIAIHAALCDMVGRCEPGPAGTAQIAAALEKLAEASANPAIRERSRACLETITRRDSE
jgi:hypothetical protein